MESIGVLLGSSKGSKSPAPTLRRKNKAAQEGASIHGTNTNATAAPARHRRSSSASAAPSPASSLSRAVSEPFNIQHKEHVALDFTWTGSNPFDVFELKRKLGEGSFGAVYQAVHKASGTVLAVKMVPLADETAESGEEIRKEIEVLKQCHSPHIVNYFGSFVTEKKEDGIADLWILMEYCSNGSVRDIIERTERTLTEEQISAVCRGTLLGLIYLHDQAITHRDIKAANVLLNERAQVKLADFGVSHQLSDSIGGTLCGTPLWMAPEQVTRRIDPAHMQKMDIWSLGITAIECAEGWPPYADLKPLRAMVSIPVRPPPTLTQPKRWSPEFNDFIASALIKDPTQRPSARELLLHPFIMKYEKTGALRTLVEAPAKTKWASIFPGSYKNLLRTKSTPSTPERRSSIEEERARTESSSYQRRKDAKKALVDYQKQQTVDRTAKGKTKQDKAESEQEQDETDEDDEGMGTMVVRSEILATNGPRATEAGTIIINNKKDDVQTTSSGTQTEESHTADLYSFTGRVRRIWQRISVPSIVLLFAIALGLHFQAPKPFYYFFSKD
ncbi:Severin kinase [Balamuthia mandrillaris]